MSTPGKRANGITASLTEMCFGDWTWRELERGERLARHHARGDGGDRQADRLGDEGHGAAGARIDLEHDRCRRPGRHIARSSVHAPSARARARWSGARSRRWSRASANAAGARRRESPECTPASSICSMMPAMKTSLVVVADGVDVDLDGVVQEAVDQHRIVAGDAEQLAGLRPAVFSCASSATTTMPRPPST